MEQEWKWLKFVFSNELLY